MWLVFNTGKSSWLTLNESLTSPFGYPSLQALGRGTERRCHHAAHRSFRCRAGCRPGWVPRWLDTFIRALALLPLPLPCAHLPLTHHSWATSIRQTSRTNALRESCEEPCQGLLPAPSPPEHHLVLAWAAQQACCAWLCLLLVPARPVDLALLLDLGPESSLQIALATTIQPWLLLPDLPRSACSHIAG